MSPRPSSQDPLALRGRSRSVSNSALARQASEERRLSCEGANIFPDLMDSPTASSHLPQHFQSTLPIASPIPKRAAYAPPFMRSASPSPPSSASMSPDYFDYYDSPPSPPRSLEDQVHVAYALDDIHLAKILLLRLKGIEVTSDDDPRIAAVQDEDFDCCFIPNGPLLDEEDEKAIREMQAREMERWEERRRLERLQYCELRWEDGKRRLRDERLAVLRRKERKRLEEEERREYEARRAADEERRRLKRNSSSRKMVAFQGHSPQPHTPTPPPIHPSQFAYNYNFPYTPTPPPLPPSRQSQIQQTYDESASVSFAEVLKSMQGSLFPDDILPTPGPLQAPPIESQVEPRTQDRLLEALLVQVEYNDEERRKRKGKQREQPLRTSGPCLACTIPSPPPLSPALSSSSSSSSSPIPRTSSWLSFRSSSASSSTTDLTSPSSSPVTVPKSNWFTSTRTKSWFPPDSGSQLLRHSCRPRPLIPVAAADSPLPIEVPQPPKSVPISHIGKPRSTSAVRAAKEGAGTLVRRMSKFVEIAKGFQTAYVTAALFSVAASSDNFEDRESDVPDVAACSAGGRKSPVSASPSPLPIPQTHNGSRTTDPRRKLRPAGYRVSSQDVVIFLDPNQRLVGSPISNDIAKSSPTPRYIPLTSPFPPSGTPRTTLPDPLPYRLHFKPVPTPTRSPFRFHALSELHTMYPPAGSTVTMTTQSGQVSWRIRSVGNPVHLRLKALHNIMWKRGVQWEGMSRGMAAMGGGRERVVGVAYEGIGKSTLSRSSSSSSLTLTVVG